MEPLRTPELPSAASAAEGLNVIRETGQLRRYRRHAPVYAVGDAATHLYLVAAGEVKLSRVTAEGRELALEHAGPGRLFGELELLLETPRAFQAVARTEAEAYALDRETLLALMAADPRFALWLTRLLGERQARLASRMETLLFKSANGRVAQLLVELARRHGQPTSGGTLIDYPITHQEIGNLIATTRETVSYAFMELRQQGIISTRRRRTIVHNLHRLGELALS